jgi:hypothetical protein
MEQRLSILTGTKLIWTRMIRPGFMRQELKAKEDLDRWMEGSEVEGDLGMTVYMKIQRQE